MGDQKLVRKTMLLECKSRVLNAQNLQRQEKLSLVKYYEDIVNKAAEQALSPACSSRSASIADFGNMHLGHSLCQSRSRSSSVHSHRSSVRSLSRCSSARSGLRGTPSGTPRFGNSTKPL